MGSDENNDFPVSLLDIWLLYGGLKSPCPSCGLLWYYRALSSFPPSRDKVPVSYLSSLTPDLRVGRLWRVPIACYGCKSRLSIPLLLPCLGPQFLLWCLKVFFIARPNFWFFGYREQSFAGAFSLFLVGVSGLLTSSATILRSVKCGWKCCSLSHVWLSAISWTRACQAPLSMGFSRREYWSRLPFPPPGDFPYPEIREAKEKTWECAIVLFLASQCSELSWLLSTFQSCLMFLFIQVPINT